MSRKIIGGRIKAVTVFGIKEWKYVYHIVKIHGKELYLHVHT